MDQFAGTAVFDAVGWLVVGKHVARGATACATGFVMLEMRRSDSRLQWKQIHLDQNISSMNLMTVKTTTTTTTIMIMMVTTTTRESRCHRGGRRRPSCEGNLRIRVNLLRFNHCC